MMGLRVQRRRAIDLDRDFLEEVHVAALGPVALVGYGWPAERLRAQFHAEVDLVNCQVIVVDGRRIGYVSVIDRGRYWYIDAFAIATNFQKRGIGQAVLRDVLDDAGRIPVRLSVLRTNRARSLYRRMGFRVIGGDRDRELMEWRAQP
ncbi:MAG TPA: GNAT family N-acetyltransferase [Kofleriaceae bacterium]|nr:GNAT family N-acetyltransferase [Kofleriaceae bacterium]